MIVSNAGPRHRARKRPSTPLTEFARSATSQIGSVSRRSAAVAATSGVAIGLIGVGPAGADTDGATLAAVDTSAVVSAARAQLATAPQVQAPADAQWSSDVVVVSATKPRAAAARATTTSRTATSSYVPASVNGNAVLEIAAKYVGVPYVSGGASPSGFDCSGLVSYVYGQLGHSLPHRSSAYPSLGTQVTAANAQPGDVMWTPGHVAIYAGGNLMIDANHPGGSVGFRTIWQSNPMFIRI